MHNDVFIAGFGGQGVLLAGNLLAYAAILEGKNASFFPAYGVEKRGGAAMCTVVITGGEIGSPIIGRPTVGIFLNQLSFDRYAPRVKPGGVCIVNSSLVDAGGFSGARLITIPMNRLAMELGDPRMVNMVAAGAYVEIASAVGSEALAEALRKVLPERNHRFIPANLEAIHAGAEAVRCSCAA